MIATRALADAAPPLQDAHLSFGGCAERNETAMHVEIVATLKGSKVILTRPGDDPGPFETLDVNFAHVSRRLFFTARTGKGLIEFQGHAGKAALTGLLSDDRGETRTISLPAMPCPPDATP